MAHLKDIADEEYEKEYLSSDDSDKPNIDWGDVEGTFESSDKANDFKEQEKTLY